MAPFPAHMVAAAAGGGISAAQLAAVAAAVGFDTVGFDDNESHWSDDDSEAAADSDDVEGVFRVCDAGLEGFRHGDAFAFFISDDAVFNSLSGGDYDVFLDKDSLVSLGIARECGIVRADLDLDLNVNKKMDPKLFHAAALVLDAPLRHDCLFTSPWFDTCCKLLAMLIRFSQFRESLCQCKYVQAAALGRRYLLHCASERDASADDAARSVFRILQALVEDVPGFCVAEEMNEDDQPKAFRALNLASRHALAIASRSPALAEDEGEGSPTDAKANPPRGEAVQFLRSLARHLFMPWPDVDDADAFLEVLLENPPASCSPTLDADGDEEGSFVRRAAPPPPRALRHGDGRRGFEVCLPGEARRQLRSREEDYCELPPSIRPQRRHPITQGALRREDILQARGRRGDSCDVGGGGGVAGVVRAFLPRGRRGKGRALHRSKGACCGAPDLARRAKGCVGARRAGAGGS
ncbi:hypothetical protein M885DRAFT_344278 [Pelagophyceae sp. CCMP2097]|nr:hypothetical protein M885DRAFT_344278 [Pelagophyceae sp. CCMP2097]